MKLGEVWVYYRGCGGGTQIHVALG